MSARPIVVLLVTLLTAGAALSQIVPPPAALAASAASTASRPRIGLVLSGGTVDPGLYACVLAGDF